MSILGSSGGRAYRTRNDVRNERGVDGTAKVGWGCVCDTDRVGGNKIRKYLITTTCKRDTRPKVSHTAASRVTATAVTKRLHVCISLPLQYCYKNKK